MSFLSVDPLRQLGGPNAGGFAVPGFQPTDLAGLRCTGAPGQALDPTATGLLTSSTQMMGQMLQLLQAMLMGLMLNQGAGASGLPSDLMSQATGQAQAAGQVDPSGSTSNGGDVAQQGASTGGKITSGSKVLVIGDSHTAGTFGDEMDRLLRAKGAQVHTVGSSGASADNFVSGAGTKVGFADHKVNGQTEKTASHATPKLEELIAQDKPDTIIVNLGANFRGAGPAGIKKQVSELGEIAKKHNIKITWVGPPRTRDDGSNPSSLQKFDQDMQAAVAPFGDYVSSAPFTPEYSGSDGVHYNGAKGTELAKKWAAGVVGKL